MNPSQLALYYVQRIQNHLKLPEVAVVLAHGANVLGVGYSAGFCPQQLQEDWWLEYCYCTENLPWLHWKKNCGVAIWVYPIFAYGGLIGVVLLRTEHSGFTFNHHQRLLHLCATELSNCMKPNLY